MTDFLRRKAQLEEATSLFEHATLFRREQRGAGICQDQLRASSSRRGRRGRRPRRLPNRALIGKRANQNSGSANYGFGAILFAAHALTPDFTIASLGFSVREGKMVATINIAAGDYTQGIQKRRLNKLNIGFYCDCGEFVVFAVSEPNTKSDGVCLRRSYRIRVPVLQSTSEASRDGVSRDNSDGGKQTKIFSSEAT
jgi:hypothetical protein